MKNKVTIIGYGNMGKAIKKALLKSSPKIKIKTADLGDSKKSVKDSRFIILSVKPQDAKKTISEIKKEGLQEESILVSIMAGVSIEKIKKLSGHKKIVRMMPNMGMLSGEGIAAWKAEGLSVSEKKEIKKILNKITENFEVKNEDAINKVTAVSGSGPAYFFLLAKAIMDSATGLGLKKEEARKLVEKTFSASALLSKNTDYGELIKKVASKGGTTEAALKVFQKEKFDKITQKAIKAAYIRSKNLNK